MKSRAIGKLNLNKTVGGDRFSSEWCKITGAVPFILHCLQLDLTISSWKEAVEESYKFSTTQTAKG